MTWRPSNNIEGLRLEARRERIHLTSRPFPRATCLEPRLLFRGGIRYTSSRYEHQKSRW